MSNSELKKIKKYYVTADGLLHRQKTDRDFWCMQNFGEHRHEIDMDEGWWLQSEEELSLFLLPWGDKNHVVS